MVVVDSLVPVWFQNRSRHHNDVPTLNTLICVYVYDDISIILFLAILILCSQSLATMWYSDWYWDWNSNRVLNFGMWMIPITKSAPTLCPPAFIVKLCMLLNKWMWKWENFALFNFGTKLIYLFHESALELQGHNTLQNILDSCYDMIDYYLI